MNNAVKNRYDFALIFDVRDGNPNGDPDAGNLPRIDAETGQGLVTDVCLKRKVRNFMQIVKECKSPYDIYVKEKAILGTAHVQAFKKLGISVGEESRKSISQDIYDKLFELDLYEELSVEEGEEGGNPFLIVGANADKKAIKEWIKEENLVKDIAATINAALKDAKTRKPTADETERGRRQMCEDYYDIRTFGAVMALKSAPNCGQVRGPVQMTFARSVDPIVSLEHSITRMAVATEAEAEKQGGDNRTMGRKNTIPYGLYVAYGFVSAHLARQTKFSEEDLSLFWESLKQMFEHDRSAARGLMNTQKLIVFKHDSALGNAPAHKLFELINIKHRENLVGPARSFKDYDVIVDTPPAGVILDEKL